MIDPQLALHLQAYVDGELSPRLARRLSARLAQDAEARALVEELQSLKSVLRQNPPAAQIPASRDFYWTQIQRQIQDQPAPKPASIFPPWASYWLRWAVPVAVAAVLMLAALPGAYHRWQSSRTLPQLEIVSLLDDTTATVFYPSEDGMSVIWLDTQRN